MKNKLLWIWISAVLIIVVVGLVFFSMRNRESIQTNIVDTNYEQEIQEYNKMINTYTWLDYLSNMKIECYDMSGNLIENPKQEQWDALNCNLYHENWEIMLKASNTKEELEWEDKVKSILSYYYENWNLESETTYIDWEQNWEEIAYYEDWQTIEYKWNYLHWQKNWLWIKYDEEWQIRGIGNYLNWEQNGKRTSFYENWQKEREVYFINWLANWEFIKYYENWNISQKWNYRDWELEWKIINYYENWQILWEATFKNGELVEEKFYDKTRKLKKINKK